MNKPSPSSRAFADRLESLARRPLQPRRRELRTLAALYRRRAALEHRALREGQWAA